MKTAASGAAEQWQVVQIHRSAPPKPAPGAPCNGCGVCCLAEPCPLGVLVSRRRHGACSALRWDDSLSVYRCGMVSETAQVLGPRWRFAAPLVARLARRWIAAGSGCDSTLVAPASQSGYQAPLPGSPLNGPVNSGVIHPP